MAWHRCTGSGGGSSVEPSIQLIHNNTTSGSSTYTVTEAGNYMIIVSNSLGGSRSITLPQGRTASFNEDIETTYGSTVVIAELQANDVITMSATPDQWVAFSKQIYKLDNFYVRSVSSKDAQNDTQDSYILTGNIQCMIIAICFGRTVNDYYESTSDGHTSRNLLNREGVNTLTHIYLDVADNIPMITIYGYDGGGINYIRFAVYY